MTETSIIQLANGNIINRRVRQVNTNMQTRLQNSCRRYNIGELNMEGLLDGVAHNIRL